jgi:hypothetical protein
MIRPGGAGRGSETAAEIGDPGGGSFHPSTTIYFTKWNSAWCAV